MNKRQKKALVKSRKFHQRVCIKTTNLYSLSTDIETGGLDGPGPTITKETINEGVIRSLSTKEINHFLSVNHLSPGLKAAFDKELTERYLLLEKHR